MPKFLLPAALSVLYQRRYLPVRPAPSLPVPTLPHCPHPHCWPERPALSVGHYLQQTGRNISSIRRECRLAL
ncbi:hypothetical protein NU50_004360 [Salmonella enterica subsp. salamae]|nr:hypothetical protein [Salmonella enterica subsp. salamae]